VQGIVHWQVFGRAVKRLTGLAPAIRPALSTTSAWPTHSAGFARQLSPHEHRVFGPVRHVLICTCLPPGERVAHCSVCLSPANTLDILASRQEISRFWPVSKGSRVTCYVCCQSIDGESRSPIFALDGFHPFVRFRALLRH
jgi:hypothetical protein